MPLVLVHVELHPDALVGHQVDDPVPLLEVRRVDDAGGGRVHARPEDAEPCAVEPVLVEPVRVRGGEALGRVRRHVRRPLPHEVQAVHDHQPAVLVDDVPALALEPRNRVGVRGSSLRRRRTGVANRRQQECEQEGKQQRQELPHDTRTSCGSQALRSRLLAEIAWEPGPACLGRHATLGRRLMLHARAPRIALLAALVLIAPLGIQGSADADTTSTAPDPPTAGKTIVKNPGTILLPNGKFLVAGTAAFVAKNSVFMGNAAAGAKGTWRPTNKRLLKGKPAWAAEGSVLGSVDRSSGRRALRRLLCGPGARDHRLGGQERSVLHRHRRLHDHVNRAEQPPRGARSTSSSRSTSRWSATAE